MSESELGSSAYVVLGLALQQKEVTPYELKQRIATSVGYFWNYSHPQIYQVTKKLQQRGMLTVREEKSGRRRKLYKVTASGRRAFQTWMATASESHTELRDLAILKLYFGEFTGRDTLIELARAQQQAHKTRRDVYRQIPHDRKVDKYASLTLQLGVQFESQAMRFWANVEKEI